MVYDIIIGPLEYGLRVVFYTCYGITNNIMVSLLGLSLAVSFFTLPMYNQADAYQVQERKKQQEMEKGLAIIKKAFKGDEKFWMLSAYYKEQDYKSFYIFRSSMSLVLQIPFFIAAYHFLTHITNISDDLFTRPDELLHFGQYPVNVLPILMTVINLVAGWIYSKDLKWREKWKIYVLPLAFLGILYNSAMGLVLYWTFNNVFSLIKNVVYRYHWEKKTRKIFGYAGYLIGLISFVFAVMLGVIPTDMTEDTMTFSVVVVGLVLLFHVPVFAAVFCKEKHIRILNETESVKMRDILLREMVLFVILGVYIPIGVITASPPEFLTASVAEMAGIVRYPVAICAGSCFVWLNIVFYLLGRKYRRWMKIMLSGAIVMALYNHFLWGNHNGLLLSNLRYEAGVNYLWSDVMVSLVCFWIMIAIWLLSRKRLVKWENKVLIFALVGLCVTVSVNFYHIVETMERETLGGIANGMDQPSQGQGVFRLSREGHNVVVIMLDRAIGAYVPYIMEDLPQLKEALDGFTYYPNSLSFGKHTNVCSSGLFGGYEYIPEAMNARSQESLKDKHNEALKVLPVLFGSHHYQVTLADIPYANYTWNSDLSIFDDCENVQTWYLERNYTSQKRKLTGEEQGQLFWEYSIYKTSPLFLQQFLYYYINTDTDVTYFNTYAPYQVLNHLKDMTVVETGDTDHYIELDDNLPHEPCIMQLPNYTLPENEQADNAAYTIPTFREAGGTVMKLDDESMIQHYHTNCAALRMLGEWFTYLRQEGVYDNTRIIVVSDHGRELGQFEDMIVNEDVDVEAVNCLLLYKDFGSAGWNVTEEFMTNADVPSLAVQNLIEPAVNPFTGGNIDMSRKYEAPLKVTMTENSALFDGNVYNTSDAPWYSVTENIFQPENWKKISD